MGRPTTMRLAALNITIHPHSPLMYIKLIKRAFKLNLLGKIRGADWGMIGTCHRKRIAEDGEEVIWGNIHRFLNIDPKGKWTNLRERTVIDASEEDAVPLIPDYLKPNVKEVFYIFYPNKHRLFFDIKNITPGSMLKLMENIFSAESLSKFGNVNLTVESTDEAISNILRIPQLTKLEIQFSMPNADDFSPLEKRIRKRFETINVKNFKQTITSDDKEGLQADEEAKALMRIGKSNGSVKGTGYAGEERIIRSTKSHPLINDVKYDSEFEDRLGVMLYATAGMLNTIMGK